MRTPFLMTATVPLTLIRKHRRIKKISTLAYQNAIGERLQSLNIPVAGVSVTGITFQSH